MPHSSPVLPLPVLLSLALAAANPESGARGAGAVSSPEAEEPETVEQIKTLVERVAGPIVAAKGVAAFREALQMALASPELPAEIATMTHLGIKLMVAVMEQDVEGQMQSTIETYLDAFKTQQRWRVRQVLDMLLEFADQHPEEREALLTDSTFDMGKAMVAVEEMRPEVTPPLIEMSLLNMVAGAAQLRGESLGDEIAEELFTRWYDRTHELLLLLDPKQKALDEVLQEQKAKGKLAAVRRTTYQEVEGANETLVTYVYYIAERSMSDDDVVHATMDHRMVSRFQKALRDVDEDEDVDFVAIKVRFDDEPGPVEDKFDA